MMGRLSMTPFEMQHWPEAEVYGGQRYFPEFGMPTPRGIRPAQNIPMQPGVIEAERGQYMHPSYRPNYSIPGAINQFMHGLMPKSRVRKGKGAGKKLQGRLGRPLTMDRERMIGGRL